MLLGGSWWSPCGSDWLPHWASGGEHSDLIVHQSHVACIERFPRSTTPDDPERCEANARLVRPLQRHKVVKIGCLLDLSGLKAAVGENAKILQCDDAFFFFGSPPMDRLDLIRSSDCEEQTGVRPSHVRYRQDCRPICRGDACLQLSDPDNRRRSSWRGQSSLATGSTHFYLIRLATRTRDQLHADERSFHSLLHCSAQISFLFRPCAAIQCPDSEILLQPQPAAQLVTGKRTDSRPGARYDHKLYPAGLRKPARAKRCPCP